MIGHDQELSADGETAIAGEPLPGASASIVGRRQLGLADTAASGRRGPTGEDSLISGATLRSDDAPPSPTAEVPKQIDRFLVLGRLGAGGMGVVVEAYDPELDRKVAIKLLRSQRARQDSQARLLREAQAMARVSHPNVVQVYDVGLVGDQVFIAMELVVGETLAQWLEAERRPWPEVVARFIDAARGLAAAHAAGLVHRDFKPDNVLLAADGRVRVADFGLAREDREFKAATSAADNPGERPLLANTLTATGVLMGTPMYMSPEQHRGEAAGAASDVFSFSVALFEGLYGVRPFKGETMALLARHVLRGEITPPPADHGVPGWLDAAVRRGLAVEADARWSDFDAYIAALEADPSRRRRRLLGGAALAISAALVGGALQAGAAPEMCTAGAQAIAAVYSDGDAAAMRERVDATFADLPEDARASIAARATEGLRTYADAWVAREREACDGHRLGHRSDALYDAQGRCLDLRRRALGRAVKVLRDGDAATLREAPMIVAKLPPLAACDDRAALLAAVPPPADPLAAKAVDDLRGRLAELDVDASAGAVGPALEGFATLKGEALDLGYRPLLAEIDLHAGRVALDAQEWGRAAEALRDAFIHATATGADAVAAEAKARQLFVDGQRDPTAALAERRHAEALIERLDGRDDLLALLSNNLGAVAAMTGDLDGARAKIREAIGLAGDDPRIRPVDLASGYLLNLAVLTNDAAERAELFDRALTILDDALGPNHPTPAFARLRAGRLAGDPERAAALLAPTCAGLLDPGAANTYELCFLCHHRLGHALVDLDRADEAAASASAGLTCFDRPIAAEDREPVAAWRALLRGRQRLYAGDLEAAGASLAAARERMAPHREAWWIALLLADVELADGRRLVAAGDPIAARPHLEAAIETFTTIGDQALDDLPRYGVARAQSALAEALIAAAEPDADGADAGSEGEASADPESPRRRAAELSAAAEAFYRDAGPGYAGRLAAVEAWRREHLEQTGEGLDRTGD